MSHTRTIITQSVRVLDHIYTTADYAIFSRLPDDDTDTPSVLTLDVATYDDMGRPEQVTLTIEPHDRLNGDV